MKNPIARDPQMGLRPVSLRRVTFEWMVKYLFRVGTSNRQSTITAA
jgi:hypothetical protein